ncbi:hypothetical protein B0O99DRAFT_594616 [Bisporella sp. PMI_857]|nr:hypothetical protein B0O99DRAFT_594616 [Bisporella sp. PMI_857]
MLMLAAFLLMLATFLLVLATFPLVLARTSIIVAIVIMIVVAQTTIVTAAWRLTLLRCKSPGITSPTMPKSRIASRRIGLPPPQPQRPSSKPAKASQHEQT